MGQVDCSFCDLEGFRRDSTLVIENDLCVFANTDAGEDGVLPGSGVIVPKEHRETVFDLTSDEIAATFALLHEARRVLDERYRPDGYTIGWNCFPAGGQNVPHAHLHVLVRFADEPQAGKGLRWHYLQLDNRRVDPSAPGGGRTEF